MFKILKGSKTGQHQIKPEMWDNHSLFVLIWPLVVEQVLAVTMGAADTVMVTSVGEFAVSGVNIIDNINNLLIIAFTALSTGGAVVVSQYVGRKDPAKVNIACRQLYYIAVLVSVAIMAVALVFRGPIVSMFYGDLESDVMEASMTYFLITAISYPFLAIYSAAAALFRSAGNSKVTMFIALLVNVMNIFGNYFLIYHAKIGITGAALSTLASRMAAAAVLTALLMKNRRGLLSLEGLFSFNFNRPIIRSILNIGIPSALENSMFQLGRLLTQRLFTQFGTRAMAANAVTSVINSFTFMPGNAFGIALLTVVGQCIGAGDYAGAKRYTKKLMGIAWASLAAISVLIMILREPTLNLFNLSPEAREYAVEFIAVHCVALAIGWVFSFALPNALRAAGDAKFVMIAGAVSMWTVRVSVAYFLVEVLKVGPIGVWLAMGFDFISRGTCYIIRWMSGKWQEKKVISD